MKYIVSPYESDAQIAHMVCHGHADFAITEDSDLLVYGCEKVCILASLFFVVTIIFQVIVLIFLQTKGS